MPEFFDVHTHLQFAAFEDEGDGAIRRALHNGVWVVNVGTQKDTSEKAVETANRYPEGVYATVGIHPIHTSSHYHDADELGGISGFTSRSERFNYDSYSNLAGDRKVVAIGECGLDFFRTKEAKEKENQKFVFIQHLQLAKDVNKPLMIHCRDAYPELIKVLKTHRGSLNARPGIIHFFAGNAKEAKELSDFGFYFSFGGVITFARNYDEVVKILPLDRILSETDSPYVTPAPYRGKRNESAYVVEVVKRLAELKEIAFEEMAKITVANAKAIFEI